MKNEKQNIRASESSPSPAFLYPGEFEPFAFAVPV
jgi:hypothetical protein